MKTEDEINREKAEKPRPDLLPARALVHLDGDIAGLEDNDIENAITDVRIFRMLAVVSPLTQAIIRVSKALGGWHKACMAGGRVMGYGFRKHGNCTWRVAGTEQADPQTHIASAERHLLEYLINPEAREEGSGLPVLEHAFSQLCITLDLVLDPPQVEGVNDGHGTVTERLRGEIAKVVLEDDAPCQLDIEAGNGKGCP